MAQQVRVFQHFHEWESQLIVKFLGCNRGDTLLMTIFDKEQVIVLQVGLQHLMENFKQTSCLQFPETLKQKTKARI